VSSSDGVRVRAWAPAALLLAVLLGLVGCGSEPAAHADASGGATSGTGAVSLSAVPGPAVGTNARNRLPISTPLTVSAPTGTLQSVTVASPYGPLDGRFNPARSEWTSSGERPPGVTFTITATATNEAGGVTSFRRTFISGPAKHTLTADVVPFADARVGVGQPIVVKLSRSVGTSYRATVEKSLVVTADKPVGPAAWYWWSSTELHYRPKDFWPAHTAVQVAVKLAGVQGGPGLWGSKNRTVSFSIGREFVMRITNSTHMMTVTVDGKQVRTVPVSMGRSGYATRSGIKTIMSHERSVRMTSDSYGGADFYDETVYYAQRITWSGEYIHSAPWSVGSQGHANVSHGCVNVSPSNAIWLFNQTQIGDPVITTGTGKRMEPGNGTGGDWNISWEKWLAGSAAGEVSTGDTRVPPRVRAL
jgi:lipoprotein-anchoring transpeptidase ErfK/SrfK